MRLSIDAALGYHLPDDHDILLAVRVLPDAAVRVVHEALEVAGGSSPRTVVDGTGRRDWTRGRGLVEVRYQAVVEVERSPPDLRTLTADPLPDLPADVLPYLNPSRYCESDRLEGFVDGRFAAGRFQTAGERLDAMARWVRTSFSYRPSATAALTTAADSLLTRSGVCRDYSHSLIALARAAGVPARMVSAYALGLDPPDFHAVAEVWLADGWHLIDATGMAPVETLAPIARGLDAAEVSFMAIWGSAAFRHQSVQVARA